MKFLTLSYAMRPDSIGPHRIGLEHYYQNRFNSDQIYSYGSSLLPIK